MHTPDRDPNSLSHLTVDQVLPINAIDLARVTPSNELHGRAVGENAIVEGLKIQAQELQDKLLSLTERIKDAESRRDVFLEAYHLSIAEERGE